MFSNRTSVPFLSELFLKNNFSVGLFVFFIQNVYFGPVHIMGFMMTCDSAAAGTCVFIIIIRDESLLLNKSSFRQAAAGRTGIASLPSLSLSLWLLEKAICIHIVSHLQLFLSGLTLTL